jgi:hypothetical protein
MYLFNLTEPGKTSMFGEAVPLSEGKIFLQYWYKILCTFLYQVISWEKNGNGVDASATRGTTALVYCLINSSLYTGTVQRWWSTPSCLDGHQGCSQLSTGLPTSSGLGWKEKRSEVQPLGGCPLMGRVPRLWRLWRCRRSQAWKNLLAR